jgi:hypothetical protein
MVRTQIQLPDEVFAKAKKVCEAREISFAELARRGIDYILTVYSEPTDQDTEWQLPKPRNLGWKGLSHIQVKAEAQLTSAEMLQTTRRKR